MIGIDVNVLVQAWSPHAPAHDVTRRWLEAAVAGDEPVAVSHAVVSGTIRVLTHPRVFDPPAGLDEVLARLDDLFAAGVLLIGAGPRHWEILRRLCVDAAATGNLVADAAHAAVVIENGASWVSHDRDFARFTALRWSVPSAP